MAMNDSPNGTAGTQQLLRPRYFPRQLVTAADLTLGQDYVGERLRRHNRLAHGCGVVCGLEVVPLATGGGQPTVVVTPGYALSPQGDEIYLPGQQTVAIDCVETASGDCLDLSSVPEGQRVYLAVRYVEQRAHPVPALPERCASTTSCEYSRLQDGFRIACLRDRPESCSPLHLDCARALRDLTAPAPARRVEDASPLFGCRPGEDGPWIVLAALDLDPTGGMSVDYSIRSQLLSAERLLELVRCFPVERPPTISAIAPGRGRQGSVIHATISGHGLSGARSIAFSGAGLLALVLPQLVTSMAHPGVRAVAFTPNGRSLVSGGGSRTVRVWEAGHQVAAWDAAAQVNALACSADGRWLATGTTAGDVQVWDIADGAPAGREVARWLVGSQINAMAFSPEGSFLATGTVGRVVQVWDATLPSSRWAQVARWTLGFMVTELAFSPDGRYLVTGSAPGAQVWQRTVATSAWPEVARLHANTHSVAFSPEGRYLATTGEDGTLRLWQVAATGSWPEVARVGLGRTVSAVAFSPDGAYLAVLTAAGIKLLQVPSGREAARIETSDVISDLAFSPDGVHLATAGAGVVLWEPSGGSDTGLRIRLTVAPVAGIGSRGFQVETPRGVVHSAEFEVSFAVEPGAPTGYYPYGPSPYPPRPYPSPPPPYGYPYPRYGAYGYGTRAGIGGGLL